MALKIDAKFERKLTCALKNDLRNLANLPFFPFQFERTYLETQLKGEFTDLF